MLSILQAHNPPYFGMGQKNYQKTVEPDKISNIFTYKKNFGMNATTDKYNVQKICIHQRERACRLSIDWQVMTYATMFTPGLSLKVTKFN